MKTQTKMLAIGVAALLAGGLGWKAFAGTPTDHGPAGAAMHATAPAGMGSMDAGMMGDALASPSTYLRTIKQDLGITDAQRSAWDAYAKAVEAAAASFRTTAGGTDSNSMYADIGGERAMAHLCHQHQQSVQALKAAANQLVAALDEAQKQKAEKVLSGFAAGGQPGMGKMMGMMGMMGPTVTQ